MNLTATLKRAVLVPSGCLIVLVLTACAARSGSSSAGLMDQAADGSAAGMTADAAIDTADSSRSTASFWEEDTAAGYRSSSRMLLDAGQDGFGLELVEGNGFNRLLVQTGMDIPPNFEVNRLNSPPRLVLDILGRESKRSRTFDTADAELVSMVRIGAHPNKSRIVLDLIENEGIEYRVDNLQTLGGRAAQNGLVITLARSGQLNEALAAASSAAISPPEYEVREELPAAPSADAGIQQAAGSTEEESDIYAAALEESILADSGKARLTSLEMQPLGTSDNMIIAQLSAPQLFHMRKTAPSEYVLTIENADFDENINTLLSPPGTGTIRSVRPVKEAGNILLRIFAAPQTTLAARSSSSGKIVVSAATDADSLRAQMAPESAGAAAKSAGTAEEFDSEVTALFDDRSKYTGRLISLDLQDTDIDNALRIIAEVSKLNIIASGDVTGKVTLRLIDVPWDQALDVILKTNGLDKVQDLNVIRIAPVEKLRQEREALKQAQQAEDDLEPLQVRYVRVSYAKAADMKPLVETILSERGSVTYDERTNQLIVKDIRKGVRNMAELIAKLDLRTPQVLLETQIVEAKRDLLRDLGAELGFAFIRSPATGNATGYNFPNSVAVGGSVAGSSGTAASFPAAVDSTSGSAISILLESADATKNLAARISALENEGRVRVISRPAVATTNNKQATIKSVEKIRIKTPSGGLSVATGQGASASGSSAIATESVEIGIVLEVTPQASPDYFVLLDINAKSSTLGNTQVDGIPSEIERSATSSVLVSSGQTFAMGGIYKITDQDTLSGVPFFKDIPVIGFLFRRQQVQNSDEELLFFLTPRIIEGSFDDAAMKATA